MKKDYVSVVYDRNRAPKSNYPFKLASYLVSRFNMSRSSKLLEIGCGRGDFLEAFHDLGLSCYGVDASDHCTKNMPHLNVVCLDISEDKLPYDDSAFDVVYHKSVLEHFSNPDHLMKETCRVLKPGGRVIILTPDWVSQMKVFYEDFTHSRPYNIRALSDLLTIYGFSEVKTEFFYQMPILWHYPSLKMFSNFLQMVLSVPNARRLTNMTKVKFFRWSVELMVLGTGINEK